MAIITTPGGATFIETDPEAIRYYSREPGYTVTGDQYSPVPALPYIPSTGGNGNTGIYRPSDWGAYWRAALTKAKAGTGLARLAVVGDSITQGFNCSNPLTTSYVALIRTYLQGIYGDGGSGFQGVVWTPAMLGSLGADAPYPTAWEAISGAFVATTGTINPFTTVTDGPGFTSVYTTTTATYTFKVRGRFLRMFNLINTSLTAGAYNVDSGAFTGSLPSAGSPGMNVTSVDLGTSGAHTVVITAPASAVYIPVGVDCRNATGVVVDNYGRADDATISANNVIGATSGYRTDSTNNTFGPGGKWSGGSLNPADGIIYAFGVNDQVFSVTQDQSIDNVRRYLVDARKGMRGQNDLILLAHHNGSADAASTNTATTYAPFVARERTLAETFGAAKVDMLAVGKNSYDYLTDQSYWGATSGTAGAPGTSAIHPGDIGHAMIAAALEPLLVS